MEFWAVEVKSGQQVNVDVDKDTVLEITQANLGEFDEKTQQLEPVYLHIHLDGKKCVFATLDFELLPTQSFNMMFYKEFQISHTMKNGSVYLYGIRQTRCDFNEE